MPDLVSMSSAALGLAVGMVTIAAYFDVRYRRIPNWLVAIGLCSGLLLNVWLVGLSGIGVALFGTLAGLALLLPFYVLRGMGAGDVKLLAAVGALVGPQVLLSVGLYGALVGGVMSVGALLSRRRLSLLLGDLAQRRKPSPSGLKLPYGLAIASGVYLTLLVPALAG